MSKFTADKALDLQVGDNRVHFDEGEEKELSLPEGFELPEGLSEVKGKKALAEKATTGEKAPKAKAKKG